MKIYLVGGAVRDQLLNLPVVDRDWVVVGATPNELLELGFQPVGQDFPVFLHPETREEYALARTERKSGVGYYGFTCYAAADVTLEQDLLRRDLTINAIAQDQDGDYIDPSHGQQDIENRLLRHVSAAFTEDPLRVLRVARFAARYADLGFKLVAETQILMTQMAESGELRHLAPERVWQETEKALSGLNPHIYFQTLHDCHALSHLAPEIDRLFGVSVQNDYHAMMDAGIHSLMTLSAAAQMSSLVEIRFAALCCNLGKGLMSQLLPSESVDQALVGVVLVQNLCDRLRIPKTVRTLSMLAAEFHELIQAIEGQSPTVILNLFDKIDVWRKPYRLEQLLIVCEAYSRGYIGQEKHPYPQSAYLSTAYTVASQVDVSEIVNAGFQGQNIRQELHQRRLDILSNWQQKCFTEKP